MEPPFRAESRPPKSGPASIAVEKKYAPSLNAATRWLIATKKSPPVNSPNGAPTSRNNLPTSSSMNSNSFQKALFATLAGGLMLGSALTAKAAAPSPESAPALCQPRQRAGTRR